MLYNYDKKKSQTRNLYFFPILIVRRKNLKTLRVFMLFFHNLCAETIRKSKLSITYNFTPSTYTLLATSP